MDFDVKILLIIQWKSSIFLKYHFIQIFPKFISVVYENFWIPSDNLQNKVLWL